MKQKFILFDRDGVINVEKSYLHKISDFEYEKNVVESLLEFQKMGYRLIIITNQAGIAKGYYSEDDYFKLERFIENDLKEKGITIEKTYFCPHHPEGQGKYRTDCTCRKPGTGNFEKAVREFNIDIEKSFMVGDRVTDLIPAQKMGFGTFLITTGYGLENIGKLEENSLKSVIVNDMSEITRYLKNL